ncbi:MAG: hypothetical protein AAF682_24185, partial [Planctomycetota bacterium]
MTPTALLRLALPLVLIAPTLQDSPAAAEEHPYPPEPVETLLRFYSVEGDEVDQAKLQEAIGELGTGASVAYGPVATLTAPKDHFLAIVAPAERSSKEVYRAAKRATGKAEELYVTAFLRDEDDLDLPRALRRNGGTIRDAVLNMASEVRWFEVTPNALLFFYTKGLDAEECADRFDKLAGRRPREDYRKDLVRHSIGWDLRSAKELSKSKGSKLEKSLGKLQGVGSVTFDHEVLRLNLSLELADLLVSGPPWTPPAPSPRAGGNDEEEEDEEEEEDGGG